MTNDQMIAQLDIASAAITSVRDQLASAAPPPGLVVRVPAGTSLQAAVDSAMDGATLVLDSGATYDQPSLRLQKQVQITCETLLPPTRATVAAPCWITGSSVDGSIQAVGPKVALSGIGVKNSNKDADLIVVTGPDTLIDRVTGLGDPAKGQRRGIRLHGDRTTVSRSFFDHIFAIGRDTVVLGGWNGGSDILIDDNWLCGGAETIMFGGGDSSSPEKIPQRIKIMRSTLTKRPEWFGMGVQIKNAFELKCAFDVTMQDCVVEYAGISEGQGAYLFLFTVRNQDGAAPWSCVRKVLIERVLARHGGGCVQFLGKDTNHPSDIVDDVTLRNVKYEDINPGTTSAPTLWHGTGRCFTFEQVPKHVTLDALTVEGQNLSALGYFANTPNQPVGLTLQNIKYPKTTYGWKIDAGGLDIPPASKNIKALMPDLVYNVTATDVGAVGYPTPV